MRTFREFRQLKGGRFANKTAPIWWGVEEIKEVRYTIGLLAALIDVTLILFFGYSIFKATVISFLFDLICYVILSAVSTYAERQYRLKQDAKDGILYTLNRLSLNKTRKYYARKTGFEN
jgi:hypothetical protein